MTRVSSYYRQGQSHLSEFDLDRFFSLDVPAGEWYEEGNFYFIEYPEGGAGYICKTDYDWGYAPQESGLWYYEGEANSLEEASLAIARIKNRTDFSRRMVAGHI